MTTQREIDLGTQLALVLGALKALAGSREHDNKPLQSMIQHAEDVLLCPPLDAQTS